MLDGIGLTTCAYYPPSVNSGALASLDGPLDNDTIKYNYDELGRVFNRAINGSAVRQTYDSLGRVTVVTNALGVFNYSYVNATPRLATAALPQRTAHGLSIL